MKLFPLLLALTLSQPALAELPSWDDPAWYAAPPNPLNLTMTADTARGVASTIGPGGGTFRATGANGDVYELTIPEGALFTDTRISILPVASAEGLPEGAGPFSGVILQPEGLALAKTGWLEITPATPIAPENRALWGFYGTGEDARGEINWPGAGDRIVIPLDHFSGAGVSIADRINLQLDRWRQRFLEDRIRSQVAQKLREARDTGEFNGEEFSEEYGTRIARVLQHGWRSIANRPASTCADVKALIDGALGLERNGQILGVEVEKSIARDLSPSIERYWSVCFPEEVQVCLDTGDLSVLVKFALDFERQRQLLGFTEDAPDATFGKRKADLKAAMERCGRFKLEITASGQWRDPSDVNGRLSFKVEVPMRLTFTDPDGYSFLIEGEAPATGVNVTFFDSECWKFEGFINGKGMLARVHSYEFRQDGKHQPLKLEIRATAPEILADISCQGDKMNHRLQAPMSPMVWAIAHKPDLNGEVFKLARFQAKAHPVLWEMEWTGQGVDDGMQASDTTKLKLIHIAQ